MHHFLLAGYIIALTSRRILGVPAVNELTITICVQACVTLVFLSIFGRDIPPCAPFAPLRSLFPKTPPVDTRAPPVLRRKAGAKCLVHCKMGVSRSASTVIAYAMKEYGWDLEQAFDHVKQCRAVTKPNPSFMKQLEEYQGILLARYAHLRPPQRDCSVAAEHLRGETDTRTGPGSGNRLVSCFIGGKFYRTK